MKFTNIHYKTMYLQTVHTIYMEEGTEISGLEACIKITKTWSLSKLMIYKHNIFYIVIKIIYIRRVRNLIIFILVFLRLEHIHYINKHRSQYIYISTTHDNCVFPI